MYQYAEKADAQSEKSQANTSAVNKNRIQTGIKAPAQIKSLFSSSFNTENDAKKLEQNNTPCQAPLTTMPYSPLQMQPISKQARREIQLLPLKQIKEQEPLEPTSLKPNNTGIPLQMKEKFENLSGFSFDDVKVHYNSYKPAQLQALAYTQGNQVYIGHGQEKHLGHELGHVVQQKRAYIKPTVILNGLLVNDSPSLESESDSLSRLEVNRPTAFNATGFQSKNIVQRKIGLEFQCKGTPMVYAKKALPRDTHITDVGEMFDEPEEESLVYSIEACGHGVHLKTFERFELTGDMGDLEYVSSAVDELAADGEAQAKTMCEAMTTSTSNVLGSLGIDGAKKYIYDEGKKAVRMKKPEETVNEKNTYYMIPHTTFMLLNHRNGNNLKAHPQATIGVKLATLPEFLDNYQKLSTATSGTALPKPLKDIDIRFGGSFSKDPRQSHPTLIGDEQKSRLPALPGKAVLRNALPTTISSKVQGLAMLLRNMADETAIISEGIIKNAKSALPIMPRTNLGDLFRSLRPYERVQMTSDPVKRYIARGESDVIIAKQSIRGVDTEGKTTFNNKRYEEVKLSQLLATFVPMPAVGSPADPVDPFVQFDGIGKIANKYTPTGSVDALSTTTSLRSYGLSSSTQLHGTDVPGILLELRALQRNVPPDKWGKLGEDIAKLSRVSHKV